MKSSHVILGALAAFLIFTVIYVTSIYNFGNRAEISLKAKFADLEQKMSGGMQQVAGRVQVADMYAEDITKLTQAYAKAVTGEGDIGSVVMLIREKSPNLPESIYRDIGREISATKEEMKTLNSAAILQKAQYEEALGTLWKGQALRLLGFPRIDLDITYKIPVIEAAKRAYSTGIEEDIKLRK